MPVRSAGTSHKSVYKNRFQHDADRLEPRNVRKNISAAPIADIPEAITTYQSLGVDTVSGATFSSTGLIEATEDALGKAEK